MELIKKCWSFFFGVWYPIDVEHYWDTSWGDRRPSTRVTYMRNGYLKVKDYYSAGFIELNQLAPKESTSLPLEGKAVEGYFETL